MNYARTIEGIPLIGVPPSATDETCDVCGHTHFITEIQIVGKGWFLCGPCRRSGERIEPYTKALLRKFELEARN